MEECCLPLQGDCGAVQGNLRRKHGLYFGTHVHSYIRTPMYICTYTSMYLLDM